MGTRSVIIFGILSALVLIFSCITLNASKFYNELEVSSSIHLLSKSTIVLRDRN